ncbi:T9SS type A sorting domain-containing protein [Aequorivita marina]|uniref:T9SS type A sorting domain-containing protein n=1 Tax=Aequorivita marina TaxID=3073654 RepID=UPI002874552B|nr:T9SS type A sorting domain-containing protein [Aequorivita sp. S2608]MDS1298484.1 T9SS type A sorting domain-containing protein [Aequorivita sp. S2608]
MKTIFTCMLLLIGTICIAQDKIYVHTVTAENTSGYITTIDHPDLNDNPDAPIVYVNNFNPGGGGGTRNDNVSGLWYNSGQWSIYNEDFSSMVIGASFNIYIASDPNDVFTHIATASNISNHMTSMDHPLLNGNRPGPYIAMSHYYNPNAVYNTGNYGQFYAGDTRILYDEGITQVPEGAAFKVLVQGGTGAIQTQHISTISNIAGNYTIIDHPALNGNPDATFVMSHYWGIAGSPTQVYLDGNLGVWYTGTNWAIYTEDSSIAFPENVGFDIVIAPQDVLAVEENQLAAAINMYPNPAKDVVTVAANTSITSIEIYNTLGQKVTTIKGNGNNDMQVDVSGYVMGNYLVKVTSNQSSETLKLIKK